ncbi:MAG: hypothetical protein IJI57_01710 [Flexilinea sp.]|nr:hypothetical protein [Flexilinea sp.]
MFSTDEVIRFFDRLAPDWDSGMVRNVDVTACISDDRMYQVAGIRRNDA